MRRDPLPAIPKKSRRMLPEVREAHSAEAPVSRLVTILLRWYARHARALPWRQTEDPYAIWISEVMLQQTRVETVRPYWNRWLQRLPTLARLARARPATVLKLWEGLGYYRRARNLQAAAQCIMKDHGGRFPQQLDSLQQLPGIGRYTAGAICSIAFNQPTSILDGNVIRLLTRLHGIRADPLQSAVRTRLWALAGELVQEAAFRQPPGQRDCAALNQGLMELGATICTPRAPRCDVCPWSPYCLARRCGEVDRIPAPPRRAELIERQVRVLAVLDGGRFLVRRQPQGSINAGLWEFPTLVVNGDGVNWRRLVGADPSVRTPDWSVPWMTIIHSITRYRIRTQVYLVRAGAGRQEDKANERWCTAEQLERLPMSAAHRKIVHRLRTAPKTGRILRTETPVQRPANRRNSASSRTGTASCRAFSSLDPASAPART
jgi:A/G-specific adenine glycosylase